MVLDIDAGKVVGEIPDTQGIHGIAIVPDLGRGFTSNGRSNNVTIFDLKTLKPLGQIATGQNPDSIIYEPKTGRVFTFNGRSNDSTAIDAKTGEVAGTIPLGGKPEFSVTDGSGKIWVNNEDTSEVAVIDAPEAHRAAAHLHRALRRPQRPGHGRQEPPPVLRLRQQDHGRDRRRFRQEC